MIKMHSLPVELSVPRMHYCMYCVLSSGVTVLNIFSKTKLIIERELT